VKKPVTPEVGPTGRGQQQQVKPAVKKPVTPEVGPQKKDMKEPVELDESPQTDNTTQGEEDFKR